MSVQIDKPGVELYKEIKTKYGMLYIYLNHNISKEESEERLRNYIVSKHGLR